MPPKIVFETSNWPQIKFKPITKAPFAFSRNEANIILSGGTNMVALGKSFCTCFCLSVLKMSAFPVFNICL